MSGNLEKPWNTYTHKHTQKLNLSHHQRDKAKPWAKEADRPDVFIGGPQQLDNQINLLDLRSTRQQRFVGQQLSQDAANSPEEETSN